MPRTFSSWTFTADAALRARRLCVLLVLVLLVAACGTLAPQPEDLSESARPLTMPSTSTELSEPEDGPSMPVAIESPSEALPRAPEVPGTTRPKAGVSKSSSGVVKRDGPGDRSIESLLAVPDATPRHEPLHRIANRPYAIMGRSFVPDTARNAIAQRGTASWYGVYFHGRRTSIGEIYDMYDMTAAHPTMALPSYARVTNVENGRSVVVRVNDRGPFIGDRIIDLSYAAAVRLGFATQGVAAVRIESIRTTPGINDTIAAAAASVSNSPPMARAPVPTTAPKPAGSTASTAPVAPAPTATTQAKGPAAVFVKIGVFRQRTNAARIGERVAKVLPALHQALTVTARSDGVYLVQAGPYTDRKEAIVVAENLRRELQLEPSVVEQ